MKRRGFTLIELLAVIVILAIIALIAVPMIMNVIEKSKKGAALSTANSYMHALDMYLAVQDLQEYPIKIEDHLYGIYGETDLYEGNETISETLYLSDIIEVKGTYPSDGYIKVEKGKVIEAIFHVDNYIIECNQQSICEVIDVINGDQIKAESITIDEVDISKVKVGDTVQLSATILPSDATNKKIKWSSSDESVATISNTGLVTIVGTGSTTITAQTSNKKTATIDINVPLYIFDGTEIKNATYVCGDVWGNAVGSINILDSGAFQFSGDNYSFVIFSNFTFNTTEYSKLVIDASSVVGAVSNLYMTDGNGTEHTLISSSGLSRTQTVVDLTDKNGVQSIKFLGMGSGNFVRWTVWNIRFE